MKKGCPVSCLAWILVLVGGINWGLVGVAGFAGKENWNVVNLLLGSWPNVEWAVYVLVGLSALWMATKCMKGCDKS